MLAAEGGYTTFHLTVSPLGFLCLAVVVGAVVALVLVVRRVRRRP
jgi:hypothetical protein